MKIRIEINKNLTEKEIIIRGSYLDSEIQMLQNTISDILSAKQKFILYKGKKVFYQSPENILFFETESGIVYAHTREDIYETTYRLYELEELLPGFFMRVSKSAILNTRSIYSMTRTLPSSCVAEFQGTHKQVYISRHYYRLLKERLEEKREII